MKLLTLAAIPETRRFGFQGLRRTHLTQLKLHGANLGDQLAQLSAGHASLQTTRNHYLNAAVGESLLARAIESMPSPIPPEFRETAPQTA